MDKMEYKPDSPILKPDEINSIIIQSCLWIEGEQFIY
jgi:hypothetical protein